MKRLATMQLWPALPKRDLTAVAAAAARSASASTTNGSEPPSSSTVFFDAAPATEAIDGPGALAAGQRDRGDPRVLDDAGDTSRDILGRDDRVRNRPAGAPASGNSPSMASAQPVTSGRA